ncbi:GPI-anchored surface protein, putative [Bodo saltans]|uniref:GPI-anchored surface protein, putative n=1 Tax=Bodo saltans TaxID=75058 RepID=A0A0S4KRE8_BODSA|nr:GPI-anchored surface protein, putative [Bodo saltans]|eukprot:CUM57939.1 GPI-anchored surface protein, putative [Bodo saltans]
MAQHRRKSFQDSGRFSRQSHVTSSFLFFFLMMTSCCISGGVHAQSSGVAVTVTATPSTNILVSTVVSDSGVTVVFAASVSWNLSCIVSTFGDNIFTVVPASQRFGFSLANVFPSFVRGSSSSAGVSNNNVFQIAPNRPTSLQMRLGGPAPRYLPEEFTETVTFRFPPACFQTDASGGSSSTASSVAPVTIELQATDDRSTEENVVLVATCSIAVGAVLSGSAGWIGLTALQSFVVMGNSSCAETYMSHYFREPVKIVAVPFTSLSDSLQNADVFGVSIGLCLGLLAIHILASTILLRCSFGGASRTTWRAVSQKLYFPGPFLFVSVYLWLSITVTAYREVVEAESSGTFTRPALIVAWAAFAGLLAILWYDGLKRGFDGHFELYPWYASEMQRLEHAGGGDMRMLGHNAAEEEDARRRQHQEELLDGGPFQFFKRFGRFQFLFLPKGRWVNTRGFGILRSNCDDRSYSFAPLSLVAVAAFGAVVVNNTECDWYFGSIIIVEGIYLIVFLLILPFRIPLLNLLWLTMKLTVLVIAALNMYWLDNVVVPNSANAVSIRLACIVFISMCGVFVGYNLLTNVIERSIQTSARLREFVEGDDRDGDGVTGNDALRRRQTTLLGFLGIGGTGDNQQNSSPPQLRRRSTSPPTTTLKELELNFLTHNSDPFMNHNNNNGANELLDMYSAPLPLHRREDASTGRSGRGFGGVAMDDNDPARSSNDATFLDSIFGVHTAAAEAEDDEIGDNAALQLQQPKQQQQLLKPSKLIRDRSWHEVPPVPIPGGDKSLTGDQELEEILVDMHLRFGPAKPGGGAGSGGGGRDKQHQASLEGAALPRQYTGGVQEVVAERYHRKQTQFTRAREEVRNMLTAFWWRGGPVGGVVGTSSPLHDSQHLTGLLSTMNEQGSPSPRSGDDERMRVIGRHSVTHIGRPNTFTNASSNDEILFGKIEQQGGGRAAAAIAAAESYGQWAKPTPARVALKLEPIPPDLSTNELAFLMEAVTGPGTVLDMSIVGRAVFVGINGLKHAEAIGTSLHNRELFGHVVRCTVISDAMATRVA